MKSISYLIVMVCVLLSVTACSKPAPQEPPREEHQALRNAIQQPINKARDAEAAIQKQNERLQQQMDESQD